MGRTRQTARLSTGGIPSWVREFPIIPVFYLINATVIGFAEVWQKYASSTKMRIIRPGWDDILLDRNKVRDLNHLVSIMSDICRIPRQKITLYQFNYDNNSGGWSRGPLESPFTNNDHESRIFDEHEEWYKKQPDKDKDKDEHEIIQLRKYHEIQAMRDLEANIEEKALPRCESIIVLNREDDFPVPEISEETRLKGYKLKVTLKVNLKKRLSIKLKFSMKKPCEFRIRAVSDEGDFKELELSGQDLTANFKQEGLPVSENLRFEFDREAFESFLFREVKEVNLIELWCRFRFTMTEIKGSFATDWAPATVSYEKPSKRISKSLGEQHPKKMKSSSYGENQRERDSSTTLNKNSRYSSTKEQSVVSMPTCPLSRSKYEQPVRASDGSVYEREFIETWLEDHDNSPLTMVQLTDKRLVPVVWNQETGEWKDILTEKQGKHPSPKVPKGSARKVFKKAQVFSWLAFDCDDLQKYIKVIVKNGYDSLSRCRYLDEGRLNTMGITKQGHLVSIVEKAKDIPPENDVQAQMSSVDDTPICPITNMPFKKPVLGSDDQIYDERFIEAWKKYYKISPYTNEKLDMQKEFVSLKWMEESKIWQEVETIE